MKLKQCYCGKIPTGFSYDTGVFLKYQIASPDCCGEWMFEFRVRYWADNEDRDKAAAIAWNGMPRKEVIE